MSLIEFRERLQQANQPGPNAEPWRQKAFAEEWISHALDAIDAEHRLPDDWETEQLKNALGAIVVRRYFLAVAAVLKATALPEERAEEWRGNANGLPTVDFRYGLAAVSGIPAHAF